MIWVAVAIAGGLGSVARHLVTGRLGRPQGTVAVNTVGTVVLVVALRVDLSADTSLVVAAGLLGGFTTFSTWMMDAVQAGIDGEPLAALEDAARITAVALLIAAVTLI